MEITSDDKSHCVKMFGYLEKRGKMRTPNEEKQKEWLRAFASVFSYGNFDGLIHDETFYRKTTQKRKKNIFTDRFGKNNTCSSNISSKQNLSSGEETKNYSSKRKYDKNEIIHEVKTQLIETVEGRKTINNVPNFERIHKCSSDSNIRDLSMKNDTRIYKYSSSCDCMHSFGQDNHVDAHNVAQSRLLNGMPSKCSNKNETVTVETTENPNEKISTIRNKKRIVQRQSFGFLKKILSKRRSKRWRKEVQKQHQMNQQDTEAFCDASALTVPTKGDVFIDMEEINVSLILSSENIQMTLNQETSISTESMRVENSESWTMIQCQEVSSSDIQPELSKKMKIDFPSYTERKNETNFQTPVIDIQTISNPNVELDKLMLQLTDLNKESNFSHISIHQDIDEIPDYDVPRSHLSEIISDSLSTENLCPKLSATESMRSTTSDIAPDSLEMPWLLDDNEHIKYWPSTNDHYYCFRNEIDSDDEYSFLDSLNTVKHSQ